MTALKNSFFYNLNSAVAGIPGEISIDQGIVAANKRTVAKMLSSDKLPKLNERDIARLDGLRVKFDALKSDDFRAEVAGRTVMLFNDGLAVDKRIHQLGEDVTRVLADKNVEAVVTDLKTTVARGRLGRSVSYNGGDNGTTRMPEKALQEVLRNHGAGDPNSIEFVVAQRAYSKLDLNSPTLIEEAKAEAAEARTKLAKAAKIEELMLLQRVVSLAANRVDALVHAEQTNAVRSQQVGHKRGLFEAVEHLVNTVTNAAEAFSTKKPKAKMGFRELVTQAEKDMTSSEA